MGKYQPFFGGPLPSDANIDSVLGYFYHEPINNNIKIKTNTNK